MSLVAWISRISSSKTLLIFNITDKKQFGANSSNDAPSNTNRWSTCDPSEWKGIPLGLTPEQSTESLYLVIDLEVGQVRKRRYVA